MLSDASLVHYKKELSHLQTWLSVKNAIAEFFVMLVWRCRRQRTDQRSCGNDVFERSLTGSILHSAVYPTSSLWDRVYVCVYMSLSALFHTFSRDYFTWLIYFHVIFFMIHVFIWFFIHHSFIFTWFIFICNFLHNFLCFYSRFICFQLILYTWFISTCDSLSLFKNFFIYTIYLFSRGIFFHDSFVFIWFF